MYFYFCTLSSNSSTSSAKLKRLGAVQETLSEEPFSHPVLSQANYIIFFLKESKQHDRKEHLLQNQQ